MFRVGPETFHAQFVAVQAFGTRQRVQSNAAAELFVQATQERLCHQNLADVALKRVGLKPPSIPRRCRHQVHVHHVFV